MNSKNSYNFIIVDDNPLDITVCELFIKKVIAKPQIRSFTLAELALEYIVNEYGKPGENNPTLLLLDVYMFPMDGFEFLDSFMKLSRTIKEQFKVIVLACSTDLPEIQKVLSYPCVVCYCVKPVTREILKYLIHENGVQRNLKGADIFKIAGVRLR